MPRSSCASAACDWLHVAGSRQRKSSLELIKMSSTTLIRGTFVPNKTRRLTSRLDCPRKQSNDSFRDGVNQYGSRYVEACQETSYELVILISQKVKTAAAIAGSTAAAAYVDAKYHISKDISTLKYLSGGDREFKRNGTFTFHTPLSLRTINLMLTPAPIISKQEARLLLLFLRGVSREISPPPSYLVTGGLIHIERDAREGVSICSFLP